MIELIDNPNTFTSGWNKGFDAGMNFLLEHMTSEEFFSKLEEKGFDRSIASAVRSLLETEI